MVLKAKETVIMKKVNMKGRLMAALLAALTMSGCVKENEFVPETKGLRIEVESPAAGTKMSVDHLRVNWTADLDTVYIGKPRKTYQGGADEEQGDPAGCFPVRIDGGGNASIEYFPDEWSYANAASFLYHASWEYRLAYFPPRIMTSEGCVDHFKNGFINLPSRYESSFENGKQRIQLPMIGITHLVIENQQYVAKPLKFYHATAAVKVVVRNDTRHPLLVERVQLSGNNNVGLSGHAYFDIQNILTGYNETLHIGSGSSHSVEVVFPEPVAVAVGDTLPIQVPICPVSYGSAMNQILTVRVESHMMMPGVVGDCGIVFEHSLPITEDIKRNEMRTMKVSINPTSERVTAGGATFSINPSNKVRFSKGNLQYNKLTNKWSFMEHQWSTVETASQNVGTNYANQDIVSLFGWGTSGYDYSSYTSVPPGFVYQPWNTTNEMVYGPFSSDLLLSHKSDWGYNAIENGGNTENSGWFTMTKAQWEYLLSIGDGVNVARTGRCAQATVGGTVGLVLLPDNWNLDGFSFAENYDATAWAAMEADGAVFLPYAGCRPQEETWLVGNCGVYWTSSSTYTSGQQSAMLWVNFDFQEWLKMDLVANRYYGASVRLVRLAN